MRTVQLTEEGIVPDIQWKPVPNMHIKRTAMSMVQVPNLDTRISYGQLQEEMFLITNGRGKVLASNVNPVLVLNDALDVYSDFNDMHFYKTTINISDLKEQ